MQEAKLNTDAILAPERCSQRYSATRRFAASRAMSYDTLPPAVMPSSSSRRALESQSADQVPALCRPGVAIIVSPLIALMRDQVEALRQAGVPAAMLNSSLTVDEARAVRDDLRADRLKLLYVAPERLADARLSADAAGSPYQPLCHRRGALRQSVGPRLPARIPRAFPHRRRLPRRAAHWRSPPPPIPPPAPTSSNASGSRTRASSPPASTAPDISDTIVQRDKGKDQLLYFLGSHAGKAASSTASRARRSNRQPNGRTNRAFARCPDHAGMGPSARSRQSGRLHQRGRGRHGCDRSPSAWASTSPTCASSPISTCPAPSKPTIREQAAPAAMAIRPLPGCVTGWAMSSSVAA